MRSFVLVLATLALLLAACGGESATSITSDVGLDTANNTTGDVKTDENAPGESAGASASGAMSIAPAVSDGSGANIETTSGAGMQLTGKVGPSDTIQLMQNGENVTRLPAGEYQLTVNDASTKENFTLMGPDDTVQVITEGPEEGIKTVTIELTAGDWSYESQPSAKYARGEFTVE